jgi:hypothetical protein
MASHCSITALQVIAAYAALAKLAILQSQFAYIAAFLRLAVKAKYTTHCIAICNFCSLKTPCQYNKNFKLQFSKFCKLMLQHIRIL